VDVVPIIEEVVVIGSFGLQRENFSEALSHNYNLRAKLFAFFIILEFLSS